MSYLYSCFSDGKSLCHSTLPELIFCTPVYTIMYLSIMTRHAAIDRGDHLGFATGRDQLEVEERHMAHDVDAQGAELS